MRVYVKHPGCPWKELNIGGNKDDLEALVGGKFFEHRLFPDTMLLMNEEGKTLDLPENNFMGQHYRGALVLVGISTGGFTDAHKLAKTDA